jgi:hypothetical protein
MVYSINRLDCGDDNDTSRAPKVSRYYRMYFDTLKPVLCAIGLRFSPRVNVVRALVVTQTEKQTITVDSAIPVELSSETLVDDL